MLRNALIRALGGVPRADFEAISRRSDFWWREAELWEAEACKLDRENKDLRQQLAERSTP